MLRIAMHRLPTLGAARAGRGDKAMGLEVVYVLLALGDEDSRPRRQRGELVEPVEHPTNAVEAAGPLNPLAGIVARTARPKRLGLLVARHLIEQITLLVHVFVAIDHRPQG